MITENALIENLIIAMQLNWEIVNDNERSAEYNGTKFVVFKTGRITVDGKDKTLAKNL